MSDHLLHVTISCGRPEYRMECVDPETCDNHTVYEDPDKAKALASASVLSTPEGRERAYQADLALLAGDTQHWDDLLHDEWINAELGNGAPWPWCPSDPPECWAKHVMEFADDCDLFDGFDWPGEITGPIKVRVWNAGGSPDDFAPEIEVVKTDG